MAKYTGEESIQANLIVAGTEIVGDMTSSGDIRIDGSLKGNLKIKGKVVIGESGTVIGEINCKNSDIEGSVEGKIVVAELLALKATSKIKGDIVARKLAIEPGSKFTGNCNMNPDNSPINNVSAQKQTEKPVTEPGRSK